MNPFAGYLNPTERPIAGKSETGESSMQRKASAVWQGDLKSGKGSISTDSGTLKSAQYSFGTRFENGVGTNPEELLAAAHAGCFTMALSAQLGGAGITATRLETTSRSLSRRSAKASPSPRAIS